MAAAEYENRKNTKILFSGKVFPTGKGEGIPRLSYSGTISCCHFIPVQGLSTHRNDGGRKTKIGRIREYFSPKESPTGKGIIFRV